MITQPAILKMADRPAAPITGGNKISLNETIYNIGLTLRLAKASMVSIAGPGNEDDDKGHRFLDLFKDATQKKGGSEDKVSTETDIWYVEQRTEEAIGLLLLIANNSAIKRAYDELNKNHYQEMKKVVQTIDALQAGDLGQLTDQQRNIAGIILQDDGTYLVPPHGSSAAVSFLTSEIQKHERNLARMALRQEALGAVMTDVIRPSNLDPHLIEQMSILKPNSDSERLGYNYQKALRIIIRFLTQKAITEEVQDVIQESISNWTGFKQTNGQLAEQYFAHYDRWAALVGKFLTLDLSPTFCISVMPNEFRNALAEMRREARNLKDRTLGLGDRSQYPHPTPAQDLRGQRNPGRGTCSGCVADSAATTGGRTDTGDRTATTGERTARGRSESTLDTAAHCLGRRQNRLSRSGLRDTETSQCGATRRFKRAAHYMHRLPASGTELESLPSDVCRPGGQWSQTAAATIPMRALRQHDAQMALLPGDRGGSEHIRGDAPWSEHRGVVSLHGGCACTCSYEYPSHWSP